MESNGNQLWLAMYNRGLKHGLLGELDIPGFNLPAVSGLPVPTRYTYPISEQNLKLTILLLLQQ
jgi:hypothetical protein